MTGPDANRVGLPAECLAPHALAAWAEADPDAVAVRYVGSGDALTTTELHRAAIEIARRLAALGIGPGTRVGTFVPNGPWAHLLFLGLGWLRAAEVPLNPALMGAPLGHALRTTEVEVVIATPELIDRVLVLESASSVPLLVQTDGIPAIPAVQLPGEPALDIELVGPAYRDIAAVMLTSGTTGPSKGVVVPWATVYQFWSWVPDDAVVEGDVFYCPLAMAHNSGRSSFNYAMSRRATFVCRDRFSATDFWSDIRAFGCTIASLVGPMTQVLHNATASDDDADNQLRSIITGPLIAEIEAFKVRFGVRVATSYGMTETGIVLSTGWDHGPAASCGRPRPDYPWPDVRIVDEWDEPVATGAIGELIVRSGEPWSMNLGYFGLPDATVAAWRNGWFHTGDAFRVDDEGWYHLVDRMKDTIRRRGENISSFELEAVAGEYEAVRESAAVAVPAALGEDDVLLVVETESPEQFDAVAFIDWITPRLPRFMVPRFVDAVAALPRNETTQRVKKQELRDRGVTDTTFDREAKPSDPSTSDSSRTTS